MATTRILERDKRGRIVRCDNHTPSEYFWRQVDKQDVGCWEWTGYRAPTGYGMFGSKGAHRYSYELVKGPIPEGLEIDHLCRNRACVNPDHLEAVTHSINVRRGLGPSITGALQLAKTHCPQGHPYDEFNTAIAPAGYRYCKHCRRLRSAESRRKARVSL